MGDTYHFLSGMIRKLFLNTYVKLTGRDSLPLLGCVGGFPCEDVAVSQESVRHNMSLLRTRPSSSDCIVRGFDTPPTCTGICCSREARPYLLIPRRIVSDSKVRTFNAVQPHAAG